MCKRKQQKFAFVEVSFGGSGPVFPLVSLESTWFLAIKVAEKLFVFDDEQKFAKTVVPHLKIESSDVIYVGENFRPDGPYPFLNGNIEEAVEVLAEGYYMEDSQWFLDSLALVFGLVIKGAVCPKMKGFIGNILEHDYSGSGHTPADVDSVFSCWDEISKWYFEGGRGKLDVAGEGQDMQSTKTLVSIVNGKFDTFEARNLGPPKEMKLLYNPQKLIDRQERRLQIAKEVEEKKAENHKRWEERSRLKRERKEKEHERELEEKRSNTDGEDSDSV